MTSQRQNQCHQQVARIGYQKNIMYQMQVSQLQKQVEKLQHDVLTQLQKQVEKLQHDIQLLQRPTKGDILRILRDGGMVDVDYDPQNPRAGLPDGWTIRPYVRDEKTFAITWQIYPPLKK